MRAALFALAYLAAAVAASAFTPDLMRLMLRIGLLHDIDTPAYTHSAMIVTDLVLQTVVFAVVALASRSPPIVLVLLLTQVFSALMFVRLGSASLYRSIVGSFVYLGLWD
jgi:hypothetical protein